MKSQRNQFSFSRVPNIDIERSSFNRTHNVKTTFDGGLIIPFFVDEALPGDTFKLKLTGFSRLTTPITPILDNIWYDTHFFSVPMRLVWSNFKRFMGEQTNPGDSTDYTIPQMVAPAGTGHVEDSVADYLGIPTKVPGLSHSSLFHRAYNLICNEWFRDQNLQSSLTVDTGDGPDDPANYLYIQARAKQHDYFTSCLPWPQKGSSVSLPLGTAAFVRSNGQPIRVSSSTGTGYYLQSKNVGNVAYFPFNDNSSMSNTIFAGETGLYADLATATAATVNQLREAFQVQKLLERDARGGTRYIEMMKSHFGVDSSDARLQRPEYLGGGSSPVNFQAIPQTSETGTTPQGNLAATATSVFSGHGFVKSFEEHCIVIGVISTRADLIYQQGLNRMFSRLTRYDFFWPELAHLGEQAVLSKEIYADGTASDETVFGYQERYAEYRYKPGSVTGGMRSNHSNSFDIWHLSQDFATRPTLNSQFIAANLVPYDRISATPAVHGFLFDGYIELECIRPMPVYSVPGYIDHF